METKTTYIFLVVILVSAVLAGIIWWFRRCGECARNETGFEGCQGEKHRDPGSGMLPVLSPTFNLREVGKQCLLLEDHLNSDGGRKMCPDCCRKHFIAAEGLAEEAIGLDKTGEYHKLCEEFLKEFREIERDWVKGKSRTEIAQRIRDLRKPILNEYFRYL